MLLRNWLFIPLFLATCTGYAQNFELGGIDPEALQLQRYLPDTTADAVVIQEFGEALISNAEGSPLEFTYHVRIKLFNTAAYRFGNVVIPLSRDGKTREETVSEIKGWTVSTSASGQLSRSALDPKNVYTEKKTEYTTLVKFALPNLTNGCTIEYSYKISSPFVYNFRSWIFQWDIPKMTSEYLVHIPGMYNYNVSLRGGLKLEPIKSELEPKCFSPGGGFYADCSKISYRMINIPALVEEDYMTAASNFRSAINFELSDYQDVRLNRHKVTLEWKNVDQELKSDPDLGGQLKKTDLFNGQFLTAAPPGPADLAKAKAIFTSVQKGMKWNGYYGIFTRNGIKKALEAHSGSCADINISLATALTAAGFDVELVLLSTRENGTVNKVYPVISEFNYLVAKLNLGTENYLLDATDPLLPFGLLPLRCINDQGRVINREKPSYWIDLKASQKETRTYVLQLNLANDGKIKGSILCYSAGYEAFNKRKHIKSLGSAEEYVENLDEQMPKVKITSSKIINLDSVDLALVEQYDVEMDAYEDLNAESFAFNPFIMDPIKENPFKLADRSFPVDMGAPSDYKISLTLNYPEGFRMISPPLNVALALPEGGGRFYCSMTDINKQLVFNQLFQLNKSIYSPSEYGPLKELFNRIVQVQKSDVIFSKK